MRSLWRSGWTVFRMFIITSQSLSPMNTPWVYPSVTWYILTSQNHPLELPFPPLTLPHLAVFSLVFILVCCLPYLLTGKTPDTSISNLYLVVSRLYHSIHSSHNKMNWTLFKYFNLVEKPRPCNGDLETQQIRNLCTQISSSYYILQPQQYWNAIRLKKNHLIRKAQIDWIKTGIVRWRGITSLHIFRQKKQMIQYLLVFHILQSSVYRSTSLMSVVCSSDLSSLSAMINFSVRVNIEMLIGKS